jgi:hypothetical protein
MILQIRLKGAAVGQFQNIQVPFNSIEDFVEQLNAGELVVCERLRTRAAGPGYREITHRSSLGVSRDGVDWIMPPTVQFIEEGA